jgi:hypothetical protein
MSGEALSGGQGTSSRAGSLVFNRVSGKSRHRDVAMIAAHAGADRAPIIVGRRAVEGTLAVDPQTSSAFQVDAVREWEHTECDGASVLTPSRVLATT